MPRTKQSSNKKKCGRKGSADGFVLMAVVVLFVLAFLFDNAFVSRSTPATSSSGE